jgi:large subunit ribosomal protein L29
MPSLTIKDIKKKSNSDLFQEIEKMSRDLIKFNLDKLSGKLKDTSVLSKTKKQIARLKTAVNQSREK